ncbi:hypothetical protein BH24ACI5_BH24ACI5_23330 [soil metagenome]
MRVPARVKYRLDGASRPAPSNWIVRRLSPLSGSAMAMPALRATPTHQQSAGGAHAEGTHATEAGPNRTSTYEVDPPVHLLDRHSRGRLVASWSAWWSTEHGSRFGVRSQRISEEPSVRLRIQWFKEPRRRLPIRARELGSHSRDCSIPRQDKRRSKPDQNCSSERTSDQRLGRCGRGLAPSSDITTRAMPRSDVTCVLQPSPCANNE